MLFLCRRALLAALLLAAPALARAGEIVVMTSGAFEEVLRHLTPAYERTTGNRVTIVPGSSMGASPTAIPARLGRGEPADVLILAASALDELIAAGHATTRIDVVESRIGMVVKAGAPKPDISTLDALRRTLLEAKSIGYSASASGVYLSTELFARLGIADQVGPKAQRVVTDRVASRVARGELEIGFQQVSELLPIPGVDFVGELPPGAQRVTIFSAATTTRAREPALAAQLIGYLTGPEVRADVIAAGLVPIPH